MPEENVAQAMANIREQWGPVIQDVIAASQGDAQIAARLEPFLYTMSQREDWRALMAALRRILAGERDPMQLLSGLDDTDVIIAGDVLRGLGVDVPLVGLEEEADDGGDMVSLDDFLDMVVAACRPDAPPGLAEQLSEATRGMATQVGVPSGIREMGRVLHAILAGEREFDLSALPPQLADKVRQVLEALK